MAGDNIPDNYPVNEDTFWHHYGRHHWEGSVELCDYDTGSHGRKDDGKKAHTEGKLYIFTFDITFDPFSQNGRHAYVIVSRVHSRILVHCEISTYKLGRC
eukprot:sb/3478731/